MFGWKRKIRELEEENKILKEELWRLKETFGIKVEYDDYSEHLMNLSNVKQRFSSLQKIEDIEPLLSFIPEEEPEIIAAIISRLQPKHITKIMKSLDIEKRDRVRNILQNIQQIDKEIDDKKELLVNRKIEKIISEPRGITDIIHKNDVINN